MEEAIVAKLLATSALTVLVGQRIHWDQRPQGSSLPAITIFVVDGAPLYTDEGSAGLRRMLIQIDCWAKNDGGVSGSTKAKLVAREVIAALSSVSMTQSGIEFQGVFYENTIDTDEQMQGGEIIYRRILQYELWHLE